MAEYQGIDLFSEIDELCSFVNGKTDAKFDLIDIDEGVEVNAGIPSHGIMDDDAMLAVDSSNALLGDPLLNLFDQTELLELQSALPSHKPETLMPVSLPADSSDSTSAPQSSSPSLVCRSPLHTQASVPTVSHQETVVESSPLLQKPVRIIVKTKSAGKMVAPLSLPKPSHNLVKIPKSGTSFQMVRMRALRSGGKLGPTVATSNPTIVSTPSNTPRIVQTVSSRVPITVRTPVITPRQTPEPPCKRLCVPAEPEELPENLPFRSVRARHSSESSEGSQSTLSMNGKRKAYELDPLEDPDMERCRKNAINAKKNRELKKAQMAELERTVETVSKERDQLAGENESLREAKLKLEQQVKHLSNILKNQSKLSQILTKLGPSSVVLGGGEDAVVSSASGR